MTRKRTFAFAGAFWGLMLAGFAAAAPPWQGLVPFARIEADPKKDYFLEESHGPWLILAATFSGEEAHQNARDLVQELREKFKIPAYLHRQEYDFSSPVTGKGFDPYGAPKRMRHANASRVEEIAVLAGEFPTVDHPRLQRTLETIKYARPACLSGADAERLHQMAPLRSYYQKVIDSKAKNSEKKNRGPMGKAFATRNPLQKNVTDPGFVDPLVLEMNRNADNSLLGCPGKYSVRIATFRGMISLETKSDSEAQFERRVSDFIRKKKMTPLEEAAHNAHQVAAALRKSGVEAYEFHDLHESIVTVGSFDYLGDQQPDGRIELNPAIVQVMQTYAAARRSIPGVTRPGEDALEPKTIVGVRLDPQPVPVAVPGTQAPPQSAQR